MKKLIVLIIALCFYNISFSQLKNSVSISGGFVDNNEQSIGGLITFTHSNNNSNYELGISHFIFEKKYENDLVGTFSSTNLNLGYLYTFIRDRSNTININFGGGVLAGYEKIDKNDELILKSQSGPIAGVYASLNLDFYIFDRLAFNLKGNEYYLFKSTTGSMNPFISAGLKFNF